MNEKLRKDFLLDFDNHIFCNHGSYGTIPKCVFNKRRQLLERVETNVEKVDRFQLCDEYLEACKLVARFIGADERSVVLVRNTTSGINAITQSLGSKITGIVVFSHVYAAMMNTSKVHREKFNVPLFVVDVNLPIKSADDILNSFEEVVEANPCINFVLLGL